MANKVDILIQINSELAKLQSTLAGFKALVNEGKDAGKATAQNTAATNSWIAALKTGLGINFANIMTRGLREVLGVLEDIVSTSVSFNSQLETSRLGIAAILRSMNPDRVTDFNQALKISDALLEQLKVKSLESAATYGELVALFQSTTAAQSRAGIPLNQQVQLALDLANAVRAVGLEGRQLQQESRDLLTGNIGPDSFLARSLGITRDDILTAQREGRLFDFLEGKLTGFKEAVGEAQDSYAVLWSNLKQSFSIQAGGAGKTFFDQLKETLKELTELVNSPGFQNAIKLFFEVARGSLKAGVAALSPGMVSLPNIYRPQGGNTGIFAGLNQAGGSGLPDIGGINHLAGIGTAASNVLQLRAIRSAQAGAQAYGSPQDYIDQLRNELAALQAIKKDLQSQFQEQFVPGTNGTEFTAEFAAVADKWYDLADQTAKVEQEITDVQKREADKRKKIREQELDASVESLHNFATAAKAFGREGFVAFKALSIAESIVSTYTGASKALAEVPYPYNFIAAASVVAAGIANVATIASQNYTGYKAGGYTGDGDPNQVAGPAHKGEFYFNAQQTRRIGVDNLRSLASGSAASLPAPNVNVSSATPKIAILNNRQDLLRLIREDPEFARAVIDVNKANPNAFGRSAA